MEDEKMDLVQEMIDRGYVIKKADDRYELTGMGKKAFADMVQSNPEFYKKVFPEWVHIVH